MQSIETTVQWTERAEPVPPPPVERLAAEVTYRGLGLKAEESSGAAGYFFWSVSFDLGGVWASAGGFGRMTLEEAKAAAVDAADRLLAAGAEPRGGAS